MKRFYVSCVAAVSTAVRLTRLSLRPFVALNFDPRFKAIHFCILCIFKTRKSLKTSFDLVFLP